MYPVKNHSGFPMENIFNKTKVENEFFMKIYGKN